MLYFAAASWVELHPNQHEILKRFEPFESVTLLVVPRNRRISVDLDLRRRQGILLIPVGPASDGDEVIDSLVEELTERYRPGRVREGDRSMTVIAPGHGHEVEWLLNDTSTKYPFRAVRRFSSDPLKLGEAGADPPPWRLYLTQDNMLVEGYYTPLIYSPDGRLASVGVDASRSTLRSFQDYASLPSRIMDVQLTEDAVSTLSLEWPARSSERDGLFAVSLLSYEPLKAQDFDLSADDLIQGFKTWLIRSGWNGNSSIQLLNPTSINGYADALAESTKVWIYHSESGGAHFNSSLHNFISSPRSRWISHAPPIGYSRSAEFSSWQGRLVRSSKDIDYSLAATWLPNGVAFLRNNGEDLLRDIDKLELLLKEHVPGWYALVVSLNSSGDPLMWPRNENSRILTVQEAARLILEGPPVKDRLAGSLTADQIWRGQLLRYRILHPAAPGQLRRFEGWMSDLARELNVPTSLSQGPRRKYSADAFFGLLRGAVRPRAWESFSKLSGTLQLLGPDLFGVRVPPEPLGNLSKLKSRNLKPELVEDYLWELNLSGAARRRSGSSRVSSLVRYPKLAMPRVMHFIWLGSVLAGDGAQGIFRRNLENVAKLRDAEQNPKGVTLVLWTDLKREDTTVSPRETRLVDFLSWAQKYDIVVVSVDEVFHSREPMEFVDQFYRLEISRGLPWTYAAASDMLRVVIVYRFGGAYSDGDNRWLHFPNFAWIAAQKSIGLPIKWGEDPRISSNHVIVAAANHPFLLEWLKRLRDNYGLRNEDLPRELYALSSPENYLLQKSAKHRYSTYSRVGPGLVSRLSLAGVVPVYGVTMGIGHTWLARKIKSVDEGEIPGILRKIVCNLVRDVYNRGDLNLVGVVDLVRRLPDWSETWTGVLAFIASQPELVKNIRYITNAGVSFRYPIERIVLPEKARKIVNPLTIRAGFLNGMQRVPVHIPPRYPLRSDSLRSSSKLEVREDPDPIDVLRYRYAIDFRSGVSDPMVNPFLEARKFEELVLDENHLLLSVPLSTEGEPFMTRIGVVVKFDGAVVLDQLRRLNLDLNKVRLIWYEPHSALSDRPRRTDSYKIVNSIGLPVTFPVYENEIIDGQIVYVGSDGRAGDSYLLRPGRRW
jgi:hypothetical protein